MIGGEDGLFDVVVESDAYSKPRVTFGLCGTPSRSMAEGIARAEEAGDAWDRSVIDKAIQGMSSRHPSGFSINDVKPLLPAVRTSLIGARFLAASKRGEIERVGYITSSDPAAHARPVTLWRRVR